jgi:hypothetical protein
MAGSVANPTAAIPVRTTNNPIASFFIPVNQLFDINIKVSLNYNRL